MLPEVEPSLAELCVEAGDSDSAAAVCLLDGGVVTGVWTIEFLREAFLEDRVDAAPTGMAVPLPLLRFFMTSVFKERGRTTPCSFRNRPQALQRGWPSGLRRQSGVVWVKQLVQVVGTPLSPLLDPPGVLGRDGTTLLNTDSGGEFGEDWGRPPRVDCWPRCTAFGVELVRGIFCSLRRSLPRFRMSLTETEEPCL